MEWNHMERHGETEFWCKYNCQCCLRPRVRFFFGYILSGSESEREKMQTRTRWEVNSTLYIDLALLLLYIHEECHINVAQERVSNEERTTYGSQG